MNPTTPNSDKIDLEQLLRDGNIIGHLNREEMDAPDAVQRIRYMMVGREIGEP